MGNLKFGDISTKDLDLVIQEAPDYVFPSKDVSVEHIPGRNGDLIIDNKCWQNVQRSYSIAAVFRSGSNFIENAEKLIKFLTDKKGYQRLEDSYDPLVYRLATFRNGGSLKNFYDQATALTVTFECKPQRFLKDGEEPVAFVGDYAILENPTKMPALPKINISNITRENSNEILLVTIKSENKVTSTITISSIPTDNLEIDSESQTVRAIQNGEVIDVNKYISLNETEFPVLEGSNPEIKVKKYSEDSALIESYNSLLDSNKQSCLALYKPYDAIVESKQKSFYIKSYDMLKQEFQKVYEATPYASYCMQKAEKYTFISYNTLLTNSSQTYTFQGDYSSKPDWLNIEPVQGDNNKINVYVGNLDDFGDHSHSVAYFISSSDKVIRKINAGGIIGQFKISDTVTITVYPASATTGELDVNYTGYNMPEWLKFEIEYDNSGSPINVVFKSNAAGKYYLPKSGLFGKASWATLQANVEIGKLKWESYKKAFMNTSGLSTSTTASFEYSYLEDWPQYEPTYKDVLDENGNVKKDAEGNPVQEIDNDVYFNVTVLSPKLDSIKYTAKVAGYFRCNEGLQSNAWRYCNVGEEISPATGFVDTVTNSNIVYYFASKPTYENVENFPEWLDSDPILLDVMDNVLPENDICPHHIDFKVKEEQWYRYTYMQSQPTQQDPYHKVKKFTSWIKVPVDGYLFRDVDANHELWYSDDTTAYMIESDGTNVFPIKEYTYTDSENHTIKDISFCYVDGSGEQHEYLYNLPPEWLKVLVIPGESEDYSDATIKFIANEDGSFKWDSSVEWINKESGNDIVESSRSDDTSIYYFSSFPSYPTFTSYNTVINRNPVTGNPETVSFTAKVAGYFRAKNSTNWKYYEIGDEICNSKVSETTPIHKLSEIQEELSSLGITVVPRWWKL